MKIEMKRQPGPDCTHKGKVIKETKTIQAEIFYCKKCRQAIWFSAEIDGELGTKKGGE